MSFVILLGISSGLCWGVADFFGGLQSRRLPAFTVAFWSQVAGGLALAVVLLLQGRPPLLPSVAWGMVAGIFGGTALVSFYRGLSLGVMGLVAPISACGAIVPVIVSLLGGEQLTALTTAGIAAALGGIVLISLQPAAQVQPTQHARQALLLALASAVGFGCFYVFLDRGSAIPGASPLWVIAGARMGSLITLSLLLIVTRQPAPYPQGFATRIAAIGILDTTANGLFTFASSQGNLAVVSVLGSLYPVATMLLGRFILSERLASRQLLGVALALGGVLLLALG